MLTEIELVGALPGMREYAGALTHDDDAADELVQVTALRAWSRRELFVKRSDTLTAHWLKRMMRRQFIDARRGDVGRKAIHRALFGFGTGVASRPPSQEWTVLLREVGNAIDQLSTYNREVLLDATIRGMSYDEIASTGVVRGTVGSRLNRARQKLVALV